MSASWAQGYVTDTIYTGGFFRELSPAWLNYVAAINGCLPIPLDRPFTYLELGCGLGRSTSTLAGAFPEGRFIGVDFNPAHVALAQRYAQTIGIDNVTFLERSFGDLSAEEVPECDFIVLHGVYTWVNASARAEIRRVIRERLKPGGLVYLSYNALPGWAGASPLRKLMVEAAGQKMEDSAEAAKSALELMDGLSELQLAYLKANPGAVAELKSLKAKGKNYLAHEFLNAEWALFYSVDIADEMADAKLSYLGSATLPENHVELLVDDQMAKKIEQQKTMRLKQLLLDYAINQRFRRDVFVRGHQRLQGTERNLALGGIALGTMLPDNEFTARTRVRNKQIAFAENLFPVIKDAIAKGARKVADLRRACAAETDGPERIDRLLVTMAAAGHLFPFAEEHHQKQDKALSGMNRAILEYAVSTQTRQQLISRQAGTGVHVDPTDAAVILLRGQTKETGKALASKLCQSLKSYGLRLARQGNLPKGEAEELAIADEIILRVDRRRPLLRRAGIDA